MKPRPSPRSLGTNRYQFASRSIFYVVVPPILVVLPLLGLAFQSDQRTYIYHFAARLNVNPVLIFDSVYSEIGKYLIKVGNFRPIGRLIISTEESLRFDIAAATGVPPHIVQGIIKLMMISALAVVATRLVSVLHGSAVHRFQSRFGENRFVDKIISHPIVEPFPLILASTLIVAGLHHPLSLFPFFLIGNMIILLGIPLLMASDKGIYDKGITKSEILGNVLLGLVAASTYELLYLLPIVCLIMILIRAKLAGFTVQLLLHSKGFFRFIVFCSSFVLVFIPIRIMIAVNCSRIDCYDGTEISFSGLSFIHWLVRSISGVPLVYPFINKNAPKAMPNDLDIVSDNKWLTISYLILLVLVIRASIRYVRSTSLGMSFSDNKRLSVSNIMVGLTFIILPPLLISLTGTAQRWQASGYGYKQWRDSLLVQIGWAFLIYGVVIYLLSTLGLRRARKLADRNTDSVNIREIFRFIVMVVVLLGLVSSALIANSVYATDRRSEQYTNYSNLISTATIEFDNSELGNAVRCHLITAFPEGTHYSTDRYIQSLNELALAKYDSEFCLDGDQEHPVGDASP